MFTKYLSNISGVPFKGAFNNYVETAGVCCGPCNPSKWEDDI
jgi:hypothetical protein